MSAAFETDENEDLLQTKKCMQISILDGRLGKEGRLGGWDREGQLLEHGGQAGLVLPSVI